MELQNHPTDENGFEDSWQKQPRNTDDQRQCSDDDGHGRILAAKMLRQRDRAEEQDPQSRKLAEHAVIRISRNVGEFHVFSRAKILRGVIHVLLQVGASRSAT